MSNNNIYMLVRLKPFYLNYMMKRVVVVAGILIILIMVFLPLDSSINYFISMLLLFVTILGVLYLNRNELLLIKGEQEEVTFSFINNSFFKRNDIKLKREKVVCEQKGDLILVLQNSIVIANIRQQSVSSEEWNEILNYFRVRSICQ